MSYKEDLPSSLSNSIDKSYEGALKAITDSVLPELIDTNLFGSVPFLSIVISSFRIGKTFKEAFHIRKIARFLQGIDDLPDERVAKYKRKIQNNHVFEREEIEYLIILLDRYLEEDKAALLSKLYLSFLDQRINWKQFKTLSMALDVIASEDIEVLKRTRVSTIENGGSEGASIARLVSSGLMIETLQEPRFLESHETLSLAKQRYRVYIQTNDGMLLVDCLSGN